MKKIVLLLLAMVGAFILTGCNDSPRDVAEKWGKAILEGDLKSANDYSTESTRAINAFVISMLDGDSEKIKSAREKFEEGLRKIETAEVVIEGDVANIHVGDDESNPMTLRMIDGKWKVEAKK